MTPLGRARHAVRPMAHMTVTGACDVTRPASLVPHPPEPTNGHEPRCRRRHHSRAALACIACVCTPNHRRVGIEHCKNPVRQRGPRAIVLEPLGTSLAGTPRLHPSTGRSANSGLTNFQDQPHDVVAMILGQGHAVTGLAETKGHTIGDGATAHTPYHKCTNTVRALPQLPAAALSGR